MSTLRSYRPVAVLLLLTLWPSLGLAQSASPAGVVTGLQGQASLIRPVVAQPIPLKFKDDLFLRDQIQTREKSVARVLLGGKALVTIRELSTFAITEEPGRAAINLKSGKIAVGVAKSLLKPGEAIEIHTPNAIAAVRGSLLVASVVISAGVPQSTFTALDASLPITVTPLGGSAAPVALNANQAVGVSGLGASTAVGPVQNVTPDVARREAQTASAPQTADGPGAASPMAGEISAAKFQEATALASLIAPPSTGATAPPADSTLASATQTQLLQESSSTLNTTTQTVVASTPPPPSTGDLGVNAISTADVVASSDNSSSDGGNNDPPPPANGPIVISDENLVLGANETVKTFSGQSSSTETLPWVTVSNSTVTGADNLIVAELGADASLDGPLLSVTDSTINTNSSLLFLDASNLTSITMSPFLFFDPSMVTTGGNTILLFNGSNLSLAGPLLSAQTTAFTAGNPALNAFGLLTVLDGSILTSTSTSPLLSFDGSSFVGANVVSVRRSPSLLIPSKIMLSGPLFSSVNGSSFDTSTLGAGATLGTAGGACCSFVSINQGGQLSSTTTAPLVQLTNSVVNAGPDAQSGGSFFNVADTFSFAPAAELVAPSIVGLSGPLLRSDNSTITALFHLLRVGNSIFSSTSPDPLIQLNNSTVTLGGPNPFAANATSTAQLLNLSGTATSLGILSLQGPLFAATGSQVTSTGTAFGVLAGGNLVSALTSAPLISLSGSSVTSGGGFLHVNGFATGGSLPTTLSLSGPLLSSSGATITAVNNLFRIAEGASVSSTTTAPLVSFSGGSFTGGGALNTATGGSLLRMFSQVGQSGTSLTLAGPYLSSSDGATFVTTDGNAFSIADGATLVSTTASPFASFTGGSATSAFSFFGVDSSTSFGNPLTVGSGVAPNVSIAGTLIEGTNATFATPNGSFLFMRAGASLTQSGSAPLLKFTASEPNGTVVNSAFNVVSLFTPANLAAPSLSLGGSLLTAVNTSIANGDPTLNTHPTVFIGDSSTVVSTSSSPFLSFDASSVNSSSNLFNISRSVSAESPTTLTLAGPLFAAINGSSFNTSSLGLVTSACCSGFFVSQGAEVVSTTTAPFIQLTNSSFSVGPDAQSGASFFSMTDAGGAGGLVAPSRITLAGPWLRATDSNLSALFNLLSVTRSELSTSSGDPLIQLSGTTLSLGGLNPFGNVQTNGRLVVLVSSPSNGTVGSPASVSLSGAGPFLIATNSNVSTSSDLIGIFNGGTLTSVAAVPLVQLNGGTLTTQSAGGFPGYVLNMGSTGGPTGSGFASAQLGGALLRTTGGLNLAGGLVNVFSGGQITTTGSTDPFAFIDGGVHTIAGNPAPGSAMFGLSGRNTASVLDAESGLTVGTDRPIQGALQPDGTRPVLTPLLQTSGATITSQSILRIDNALLEATAPLLNLTATGATPSVLTATGSNAIDLSFAARVSSLGSSLIRLDGSVLNINDQHLIVAAGGSKLSVGGDLVSLVNGATLNILNGPLLRVTGDSFVKIDGGLISFGGTGGNTVNVTNNICPCSLFGGVPVALQNGALASNVQISSPIKNAALGTINLSPNAALAVVNGAGSKLIVGPQ